MAKVMLVDDDSMIRDLCFELLRADGHEVVTLPGGSHLLPMIHQTHPDLILMDLRMNREQGLDLMKKVLEDTQKKIPVIIFSGAITPEIEQEAFAAGASEVLHKGSGTSELRIKIKKILENRSAETSERKEKILIVDDEQGIRNLLKTVLERKGFTILTAKDGFEALKLLEAEHPDVILLDVAMPGMDGILTLKKIRQKDPHVGVVMATGLQDEKVAREAAEHGAYAYVLKPFDLKYLEMVVLTRLLMAV